MTSEVHYFRNPRGTSPAMNPMFILPTPAITTKSSQWRRRLSLRCPDLGRLRAYGKGLSCMTTDSIPNFADDPAVKLWARVPDHGKRLILENVWCTHCETGVSIVDYTGSIVGCDLLLSGKCAVCGGDVARVVEST